MNIKCNILLIFFFFGTFNSVCQHDIKMVNPQPIDEQKYKEIKGSPYLWKKNKRIIIYDDLGIDYNSIFGNYNMIEKQFEVYQNKKFISLPHDKYPILKVIDDEDFNYTFYSNLHPRLTNRYCVLVHSSDRFKVIEDYDAKLSSVRIETPGKATLIDKVRAKTKHYLQIGDELISFELNKKKFIKQFGHEKELKSFVKKNKIKFKHIEDVIPLFQFLDDNSWLQ